MRTAIIIAFAVITITFTVIAVELSYQLKQLDERIEAVYSTFDQCAEDNGWNPVIGCYDRD